MIESEKTLERKLRQHIEALGGLAIKLVATHFTGLPDRLILLPGARILFVEVKTTKQKPRARQRLVHDQLRRLGFEVIILDRSEQIKLIE